MEDLRVVCTGGLMRQPGFESTLYPSASGGQLLNNCATLAFEVLEAPRTAFAVLEADIRTCAGRVRALA